MNIKINSTWSVLGSGFNWTLRQFVDGTGKDGQPIRSSKDLHYSNLTTALRKCVEYSMQGAETAEEFLDRFDALEKQILIALKDIGDSK